jgi:mannose-6-phosphate isomerase-like protein (cupin superfamily)
MRYKGNSIVLRPNEGEILGQPGILHDRFMVSGKSSGGGFALIELLLPPKTLAAPLHKHKNEDEYSYVLEGIVGALLGDKEVFGKAGDLIFKPRDQWHTFWNAGDQPLKLLEIISPGGFEEAFREMDALGSAMTPGKMTEIAGKYDIDVDFEATGPIIEKHGLAF